MKLKTVVTTITVIDIDLAVIPVSAWPEEALALARTVLSTQAQRFIAVPKPDRKLWLVAEIEALAANTIELEDL